MQMSIFFAEEPHASPSALQDCDKDWQIRVATSCLPLVPLLQSTAPSGWFGRTSPVSSPVTKDETLRAFWASSLAKKSKSPLVVGRTLESLRESPKPTVPHTGCWTLSTSEWPSDAAVCSLSDDLETGDVPQRFLLSATACRGILRRAE